MACYLTSKYWCHTIVESSRVYFKNNLDWNIFRNHQSDKKTLYNHGDLVRENEQHIPRVSPTSKVCLSAQTEYAILPPGGTVHPKLSPTVYVSAAAPITTAAITAKHPITPKWLAICLSVFSRSSLILFFSRVTVFPQLE